MKNQKEIEAAEMFFEAEIEKLKKSKSEAQSGRPFPVPPSGCPEGWTDNGGGMCVLNS
jgi:hypothetical protein